MCSFNPHALGVEVVTRNLKCSQLNVCHDICDAKNSMMFTHQLVSVLSVNISSSSHSKFFEVMLPYVEIHSVNMVMDWCTLSNFD